jgi:hypothetical protein
MIAKTMTERNSGIKGVEVGEDVKNSRISPS